MLLVYCMGERAALLFNEIILTTSAIAQPDLGCKVFDARVFVVPVLPCRGIYELSHPTVGVALVGLTNNVPVRLSSSSEELPVIH